MTSNSSGTGVSSSERLDAAEEQMLQELDVRIAKSPLFVMGEIRPQPPRPRKQPGRRPPTLAPTPCSRTTRASRRCPTSRPCSTSSSTASAPTTTSCRSAKHALAAGHDEETVLACLLHDIAVIGFIRSDHGWWGAQLIEPYVSEKVAWAIRAHQVLRFYPDPSVGYEYPEMYIRLFGEDFEPEEYIQEEYKRIKDHKWYMTGRLITINDIYSFDPDAKVVLGRVRGHRRPQLQAARRRPRLRRQPLRPHVAHPDLAHPLPLAMGF